MSTAMTPSTLAAPAVNRAGWRRALAVDLRLQRAQWLTTLALAGIALAAIPLIGGALTSYAGTWAALAWFRYGRGDTPERTLLRAGLGISRADRIRGRVALVGLESAVLIAVFALGTVLDGLSAVGGGATVPLGSGGSSGGSAGEAALMTLGVLLVSLPATGAVIGKECTVRRPGWAMVPITVVCFGALGLLCGLVLAALRLPLLALGLGAELPVYAAVHLVIVAAVILVLRGRVRAWIRTLDGPRPRGGAAD